MIIIETLTEAVSQAKQDECYAALTAEHIARGGQTVTIGGKVCLVPLGCAMGPNVTVTERWDVPELTPDATYEIENYPTAVLSGTPETDYVRRERPEEWLTDMKDMEFNAQFKTPEFK